MQQITRKMHLTKKTSGDLPARYVRKTEASMGSPWGQGLPTLIKVLPG